MPTEAGPGSTSKRISKMLELLIHMKSMTLRICSIVFCHRAIYSGISAVHGIGCWTTDKPELYGSIAAFYAILALRG